MHSLPRSIPLSDIDIPLRHYILSASGFKTPKHEKNCFQTHQVLGNLFEGETAMERLSLSNSWMLATN